VTTASRTVHVDARRLERWVAGFGERHGAVATEVADGAVVLSGADGALASLAVPYPPLDLSQSSAESSAEPGAAADPVAALAAHARADRRVAVLLVRRGGYAVALVAGADGGAVTASKVGSRYVQGRTAAGGWSQQRFARRREGQTAALLDSAAATAARVLEPWLSGGSRADVVVTGGDRALADRLLADPRLRELGRLPRERHLDVGDPRAADVAALPERLRGVRITLTP
jgi:hypothetical protein